MATQILMPALSPTMTEGKLARWLKGVGDDVRAGDVIAEIETDKATMEVEAVDEGKLARILVDEGTEGVAVNTPIAVLSMNGEDVSAAKSLRAEGGSAQAESGGGGEPTPARSPSKVPRVNARKRWRRRPRRRRTGGRRSQSPCARRCAMRWLLEMRRDGDVFLIGEEVAQYQGAYKISQGLLDEFGAEAGDRYADHRTWVYRPVGGRGAERAAADRRVHDVQLRHAGDGPDHQ